MLVADLLATAGSDPQQIYRIPTIGGTGNLYPDDQSSFNAGVQRKIFRASPRLAFAFSGSGLAAKIIAEDARANLSGLDVSRDDVFSFLRNINSQQIGNQPLTVVGLYLGGTGACTFRWTTRSPNDVSENKHFFEGSGASALRDILERAAKQNQSATPAATDDAIISVGSAIARAWKTEEYRRSNLNEFFGGGFELVAYQNGRIAAMTDWALLYWHGRFQDNCLTDLCLHGSAYAITYHDERMFIRVRRDTFCEYFIIPPVYRGVNNEDRMDVNTVRRTVPFDLKHVFAIFEIYLPEIDRYHDFCSHCRLNADDTIIWNETDTRSEIIMSERFRSEITDHLSQISKKSAR